MCYTSGLEKRRDYRPYLPMSVAYQAYLTVVHSPTILFLYLNPLFFIMNSRERRSVQSNNSQVKLPPGMPCKHDSHIPRIFHQHATPVLSRSAFVSNIRKSAPCASQKSILQRHKATTRITPLFR